MLEVRNTEVAFLGRAIKSAKNAYSINRIDTRWKELSLIDESEFARINKDENLKSEIESVLKNVHNLGSNWAHQSKQCHDHFLSGVTVTADLKFPRYISCEFQRYHWFEIISSQSTMHTIVKVMSRFDSKDFFNEHTSEESLKPLAKIVGEYNFLVEKNKAEMNLEASIARSKDIERLFHEIKSNLPEGYEMWLTFTTNYLQLATMLTQRYNHRLEDWKPFTDWIHRLPLFDFITDLGDLK